MALSTRFRLHVSTIQKHLQQARIKEWGKVQRVDSDAGDTIHSSGLMTLAEDCQDAMFVWYVILKLELQTFYGQLKHLYLINFICSDTWVDHQQPIIIAAI
ncbi:hypothetical protein V8E53_002381 [Lactarius tabidus]